MTRRNFGERAIESAVFLCGISAILFVFGIFLFVLGEGWGFLVHKLNPAEFFGSIEWRPTDHPPTYGALALIAGSGAVTLTSMMIAVPFGLGTAIFVSEFCSRRLKEFLKIVIELLAAIPSVVWGFVGLTLINPLIRNTFEVPTGLCVLNAGIVLALMSVPIIMSIGEDALKAVPDGYREAAEALGATKWQVIYKVLLPAAKNGLLAAVLLGIARAVGETIAVLLCTGHSIRMPFDSNFPFLHPLTPVRTLTATVAAELGETAKGSDHWQVLFVLGVLLFAITFAINLTADLIVRGIRKE